MIMSVKEFKELVQTDVEDAMLEAKLQALEILIRKHTNNNFQKRGIRASCQVMAEKLYTDYPYFKVGDTIQISESIFNDGIYVIQSIEDHMITPDKDLLDESTVLVTKVEYPVDVQMGVVNMLKWDLENREKVGIQSETIL